MDTKVSKSGDTMNGNLTFKLDNAIVGKMHQAYNATTTTVDSGYLGFMDDINNVQWAQLKFQIGKDSNSLIFMLKDKNGKWRSDSGVYCTTNITYLKSVGSNNNNSVVTTTSHGSRYVRFGNGLQICWGVGTGVQVFPQPFRDTDYMIADSDLTYHKYEGMWTTNKTTTQFQINNSGQAQWIAIGYWY